MVFCFNAICLISGQGSAVHALIIVLYRQSMLRLDDNSSNRSYIFQLCSTQHGTEITGTVSGWMMVLRHISRQRPFIAIAYYQKEVLCHFWRTMKKHNNSRRKKGKRGVTAEPSDPMRTKGSLRCMVSIERSTQPPSFIRQAELSWRFLLLLHTIDHANRMCPLWGVTCAIDLHYWCTIRARFG